MRLRTVVAAASLLTVAACTSTTTGGQAPPSDAVETTNAPSISTPSSVEETTTFPDGSYTVGVDLPPGTYSAAPTGSCFWAKFDTSGATIDNDFTQATGVIVKIEVSVASFHSEGCGPWTQLSAIEAGSPESDTTSCPVYVSVLSKAQRRERVQPFLEYKREQADVVAAPSAALVAKFAEEVREVCSIFADDSDNDYTAGFVSNYVFDENKKKYSS